MRGEISSGWAGPQRFGEASPLRARARALPASGRGPVLDSWVSTIDPGGPRLDVRAAVRRALLAVVIFAVAAGRALGARRADGIGRGGAVAALLRAPPPAVPGRGRGPPAAAPARPDRVRGRRRRRGRCRGRGAPRGRACLGAHECVSDAAAAGRAVAMRKGRRRGAAGLPWVCSLSGCPPLLEGPLALELAVRPRRSRRPCGACVFLVSRRRSGAALERSQRLQGGRRSVSCRSLPVRLRWRAQGQGRRRGVRRCGFLPSRPGSVPRPRFADVRPQGRDRGASWRSLLLRPVASDPHPARAVSPAVDRRLGRPRAAARGRRPHGPRARRRASRRIWRERGS